MVADAMIPPEGRTVKCGRCANQWFVESAVPEAVAAPEPAAPEPVVAAPIVETPPPVPEAAPVAPAPTQLPAPQPFALPVKPFMVAAPLLAACWLIVALYAYFPTAQYGLFSGIYGALGASDTRGIVFDEVTMEEQDAGEGRVRYVLFGSMANHAATARHIPRVRVALKDKDNDVLWSRTYPVDTIVKPGEIYPFRIEDVQTSFAGRVSAVVMDVGNNFELVMR